MNSLTETIMFWSRTRRIELEIVNSKLHVSREPCASPDDAPSSENNSSPVTIDTVLRLLSFIAIFGQAGLAVYGYSVLSGYYEGLGIYLSELDIGLPTQLLYGYVFGFVEPMSEAANIPYPFLGPALIAILFVGSTAALVWALCKKMTTDAKLGLSSILGCLSLLILLVPVFGIGKGLELAKTTYNEESDSNISTDLKVTHIIKTSDGTELTGRLIIATKNTSYILQTDTIYKINNSDNKIVRIIELSPDKESTENN